jgi:hypothetical protein
MERDEIPDEVVRFINDHIDSVPQLEGLLLIWESAPRAWTAARLAERLYVSNDYAARVLQHLQRQRLVSETESGGFAFNPEHPDAIGMPLLAAVYSKRVVRIAELVHAKASPAVREFARAFRIKREK